MKRKKDHALTLKEAKKSDKFNDVVSLLKYDPRKEVMLYHCCAHHVEINTENNMSEFCVHVYPENENGYIVRFKSILPFKSSFDKNGKVYMHDDSPGAHVALNIDVFSKTGKSNIYHKRCYAHWNRFYIEYICKWYAELVEDFNIFDLGKTIYFHKDQILHQGVV